jgi:hypothetical protein
VLHRALVKRCQAVRYNRPNQLWRAVALLGDALCESWDVHFRISPPGVLQNLHRIG